MGRVRVSFRLLCGLFGTSVMYLSTLPTLVPAFYFLLLSFQFACRMTGILSIKQHHI